MRCPYLENYLCSFADVCRIEGIPKFCAYHVLQKEEYRQVLDDARKNNYFLFGVEYILKRLNEKNYDVLYNNTNVKTSSQNITFYPARTKKLDDLVSDVGASSLASCPAKIILHRYVEPPEDVRKLFEIGRQMHEIFNKDFGPKYKNQFEFTNFPLRREDYCEIPILYELERIKIGGRIDCLLAAKMNDKEIPAIVDLKRSKYKRYEKHNYLVQLGIYKLGLNADEALLITIKRNDFGYPTPTINYVDAEFDEWLEEYLLRKFEGIAHVLTYGPHENSECNRCEFKSVCRKFDFESLQTEQPWNKFLKFL